MNPTCTLSPLAASYRKRQRFLVSGIGALRRRMQTEACEVSVTSVRDFRHRASVSLEPSGEDSGSFPFIPELHGEYSVGIYPQGARWPERPVEELSFYVTDPHLAGCIPWKGDLHMHTTRSDGAEAPLLLLARMRGLGLDFVAVTDHRIYSGASAPKRDGVRGDTQPATSVTEAAERVGEDLLVLPGEEVNFCQGPGHIVSLCAERSVTDEFPLSGRTRDRRYLESFENMDRLVGQVYDVVAEEVERLDLPPTVDRRLYGYLAGLVGRIHAASGIAIIAHPFWSSRGAMDLVRSTLEEALRRSLFDAVEVFGGMSAEENLLSYAFYASQFAGRSIPVVGSSDTHGESDDWSGRCFTLAFCPSLSPEAVVDTIRDCRTTACLEVGGSEHLIAGSFPLVEYSHFLLRRFFPEHDRQCSLVGQRYRAAAVDRSVSIPEAVSDLRVSLQAEYRRSFPAAFENNESENPEER